MNKIKTVVLGNEDAAALQSVTTVDATLPKRRTLYKDSISHFSSCYEFNNKEAIKLKLEFLKYQMENAKLERQRIQEALQAEATERQSRTLQNSLRLRAARLNAVAAEMKLPSGHPALKYTEQEKLAQEYLQQFENT